MRTNLSVVKFKFSDAFGITDLVGDCFNDFEKSAEAFNGGNDLLYDDFLSLLADLILKL